MEPTFTEATSETVTAKVMAQLAAALPPAHCHNPDPNESLESKVVAFLRLQN
jgi:hypothetical protein